MGPEDAHTHCHWSTRCMREGGATTLPPSSPRTSVPLRGYSCCWSPPPLQRLTCLRSHSCSSKTHGLAHRLAASPLQPVVRLAGRSNRGFKKQPYSKCLTRGGLWPATLWGLLQWCCGPLCRYSVPVARLSGLAAVVALGWGGSEGAKRENRSFGPRHLRAQVTQHCSF